MNKLTSICCPQCHITYLTIPQKEYVRCQDCGCVYWQERAFAKMFDFVRWAIHSVRGEK